MDHSPTGSFVHGISQAEHWTGLPFSSPGDLLNPGIEPLSLILAGGFFATEPARKPLYLQIQCDIILAIKAVKF